MDDIDAKVAEYWSLEPVQYPFVETLVLEQRFAAYGLETSLTLTLRSRHEWIRGRLVLSFSKVRKFRLDPDIHEISFALLTILPVTNGWENISYEVFNEEQAVELSFYCDNFSATLVRN